MKLHDLRMNSLVKGSGMRFRDSLSYPLLLQAVRGTDKLT